MVDFLEQWWGLILALTAYALAGAWWGGRIQKDVENLKAGKFVSNESCTERQTALRATSDIQFASGNAQFAEIKTLIAANDQASQHRHQEVMNYLLNLGK